MSDIFISYAQEDRAKAKLLAEALERSEWSVWWDRKIPLGRRYPGLIEEELNKAPCVLVLWSKSSIGSDWVNAEAEAAADDETKLLIPVLLEKVKPPLRFRIRQAADLTGWTGDASHDEIDKFVADVSSQLSELLSAEAEKLHETAKEPIKPKLKRSRAASAKRQPKAGRGAVTKRKEKVAQAKLLRVLEGHSSQVLSLAFSPDDVLLASGAEEGLRIWQVETGEAIHVSTLINYIQSVAFSPDGRRLLTGGAVSIWDVESGKIVNDVFGEVTDMANSVAFSSDGQRVIAGSPDGYVKVWNVESGEEICRFTGHKRGWSLKAVFGVAFSPDGQTVASAGGDSKVRLWDVETCIQASEFPGGSAVFSTDGTRLAVGGGYPEPFASLWDLKQERELFKLAGLPLVFTPDGTGLVCITGSEVKIWELASRKERLTLRNEDVDIRSLALSSDGGTLAVGGVDGVIRLWRLPIAAQR